MLQSCVRELYRCASALNLYLYLQERLVNDPAQLNIPRIRRDAVKIKELAALLEEELSQY